MIIIDSKTVAVESFNELKEVLSGNNTYNYIYFNTDITLTSGISINQNKTSVTIDGTYNGVRHTFTDMKSAASTSAIYVNSGLIKNVVFKNVSTVGYNYYGLIYVPESNTYQDTVIEYNNLSYVGPQITYNPSGISRYIDCDIKITTSYASPQEVAECNRIEIGGTTTITHDSASDSSFWFRGNAKPYFKILENANVTMTSLNRELFYGTNELEFDVLEGATFNLTTALGMGYDTFSTGNVLIDKSASLKITQTKQNGSYPTWYCTGSFVMNEGSSLEMINNYSNINTSNYNIYFRGSASSFTLNNPEKLVLYNSKARVIYTNATIHFNLTYSRINMWDSISDITNAGSIYDIPPYSWYKEDDLSMLSGTFSASETKVSENNYTTEELKDLPLLTNFKFQDKYAISIGKTKLLLCAVTDESLTLSGYVLPYSNVKISYLNESVIVEASSDGFFSIDLSSTLAIGTEITYTSNFKNSFIYQTRKITTVYKGELVLDSAPSVIKFLPSPISSNPILCPRLTDVLITVIDSRVESSNWKLYATINHDLISSDGYELKDALVNVEEDGNINSLSSVKTLMYTGENNGGSSKTTNITWDNDKGLLLRIKDNPVEQGQEYQAIITWSIEE